jgi:hypothetical protein
MPAQFTIREADLRTVLRELRQLDPNLRKELQKEMKTGLAGVVEDLADGVPSKSPLSGFNVRAKRAPYRWVPVAGRVLTPMGKRAKKPGFYPVVSMSFRSTRKGAGFEIMELAGSKGGGQTSQGSAMIYALNQRFPIRKGLGRFVIPEAKDKEAEAVQVARQIIERYVALVNRKIRA